MSSVIAREEKGKAVLAVYIAAKDVSTSLFTNKTECFSFKSRCAVWVAKCLNRLVYSFESTQLWLETTS